MNVLAKIWFAKTNFQSIFFFIRRATQSLLEIRKSYERFLKQSSKTFGARRRHAGGRAWGLVIPGGGQGAKPLKNFAIWLCQRPLDLLIFRSLRTQKTTRRKITMAIKRLLAGTKLQQLRSVSKLYGNTSSPDVSEGSRVQTGGSIQSYAAGTLTS